MYDSKYTGAQIEEMLERAGSDLIEAGEDESYVVKVIDSEGTVLAGFKESSELIVPVGLTDDAYTLINALYEKLADAVPALQDWASSTFVDTSVIEGATDDIYVVKAQDAQGTMLLGVKESGEVEMPIGVSDDGYTLINALYEKLSEAIPALQDWASATFENAEDRKALIDSDSDDTYVLKMQDAEGNLLQGFKESGEVEIPVGIADDTYELFTAIYNKLNEISDYLAVIHEKIDN